MINDFQEEVTTRREILKNQIKGASGKCSMLMLILGLLSQGIGILAGVGLAAYSMINGTLNMNDGNYMYGVNKEFINIVLGITPCIVVDIIIILIGLKTTKLKLKRDIFNKSNYSKKIIPLGMASVGGVLLISTTIYLFYSAVIKFMGLTIPAPDFTFPSSTLMRVMYISYICILGPILEEIIFRGILLKSMKKYGAFTAIIFTSIVFSMFHLNLVQFMTPLLLGILLAFVTVNANSIIPAIIIHMFNNSMATVITCVAGESELVSTIISTVFIFGGVIGLIFFINQYKNDIKRIIKEDHKLLPFRKKLGYCFSNGWSVGYIIFYVTFILINFVYVNVLSKM